MSFQFRSILSDAMVCIVLSSRTVHFVIVFHTALRDEVPLTMWTAWDFQLLMHHYVPCSSQDEGEKEDEYLKMYF